MSVVKEIAGKVIKDSRGELTIEATLVIEGGFAGTASVPSGKSKGAHEVKVIEPDQSVKLIESSLSGSVVGVNFETLLNFDHCLISLDGTKNKSHFGGNTLLALSVAFARAQSHELKRPLFKYIDEQLGKETTRGKLRLYANMINGGLHAKSNLRFQEHIAIPEAALFSKQAEEARKLYVLVGEKISARYGASSISLGDEGGYSLTHWNREDEPFEIMAEAKKELGYEGMDFGMDAAGSDIEADKEELLAVYEKWQRRFGLIFIEDPFREEDFTQTAQLHKKFGDKIVVCGDDLTTTNVERMKKARVSDSINGIIIKPNQIGTLSEALEAVRLARGFGWSVVVSHRSGETMDDWVADFAFGAGADGLKLGAPSNPERVAKYDRLLRIEEETATL